MWSIACYPSYTPEGGLPRARRIFRRYLPAEILTYLIINFLWAGLSLWLVSTLDQTRRSRANGVNATRIETTARDATTAYSSRSGISQKVPPFSGGVPRELYLVTRGKADVVSAVALMILKPQMRQ